MCDSEYTLHEALTLGQLYAKLTKILTENPHNGALYVAVEGCDCMGLLGSAEVKTSYRDEPELKTVLRLGRTDRTMGGW